MIANRRTLSIFRATPLAIMLIFLGCTDTSERSTTAPGQSQPEPTATIADDTPRFRVDPFWARDLPDNWILGEVAGVAVDPKRSRLDRPPTAESSTPDSVVRKACVAYRPHR